jgi:hypothetical protein
MQFTGELDKSQSEAGAAAKLDQAAQLQETALTASESSPENHPPEVPYKPLSPEDLAVLEAIERQLYFYRGWAAHYWRGERC